MKRYCGFFIAAVLYATSAHATEVKEVVTPKGLKAWLVEEHSLPLVAVKIAFTDSGYAHDPAGKEGRANMVAAMLMEGAGDMDSNTYNRALESRAIQLNLEADDDLLQVLMQTLSEHKEKAFAYMGLALTAPRFDESAIERVRSQSISVMAQQDQAPGYQAYRGFQKLAFPGHPYSQPAIGTHESLKALAKADLTQFTSHYLTKENILIAASGDITPEELSRLLDENLGTLPDHFTPDAKVADAMLPAGKQPVIISFDIPQTMVMFGTEGLRREDPDYFAAYVMNHILGGGASLSSKLGIEVREKRGLAYSIHTQLDPLMHAGYWHGSFSTRNDKAGEAIATLHDTLQHFVSDGPTDKELADAKSFLTGSFVLNLDNNAAITGFLLTMQQHHLGSDYLNKRNALVEAVTRDSVAEIAKRLIHPDALLMVMVGKPNLPQPAH